MMDCLRRAVHHAYGWPLDELPNPVTDDGEEFWNTWNSWALGIGAFWWGSTEKAPIALERWFAAVHSPWAADEDELHALVMAKDGFLFDPNSIGSGVLLGSATPTAIEVGVTFSRSYGFNTWQGVIAHFTDNNNFACAVFDAEGLFAIKVVGGVMSIVGSANMGSVPVNVDSEVALKIYPSGNWLVDFNGRRALSGNQSVFATGGTLASGKSGIIDWYFLPNANTRTYRQFSASIPTAEEAAIFPGRSLVWGYDGNLTREASGGTYYAHAAGQQGVGRPMLGPAGTEGLVNRLTIASADTSPEIGATANPCPRLDYEVRMRPAYLIGRHQA